MVVEDDDAVGQWWSDDVVELETGPRSSTDISARLMPRNPAQIRTRSPGTPDGPVARPRMPDARSVARDEVTRAPAAVRYRMSDSPVERDKKPRVDDGTLSHTSVLAHADGFPRNVNRGPKIVVLEDDRGVDSLRAHAEGIHVRPDCVGLQLHSCVANGKMYNDDEMRVVACMLSGVDITEVFSPIRVNKVCKKFGLIPGDSFDLRDGYDLSDDRTQAYVVRRVREANPKLLIGSPPCTMFSRLQALNIHVQGLSGKPSS